MRTFLLTFIIFSFNINFVNGQDVFNPYKTTSRTQSEITLPLTSVIPFTWYDKPNYAGFSGEYEINLLNHPWYNFPSYQAPAHISYSMEVVSFPFMPNCAFYPNGCSGTTTRELNLPPLNSYDPLTFQWGELSNYFYNPYTANNLDQSLVSTGFRQTIPLTGGFGNRLLPHTIIKHTVYIHCGPQVFSAPYPPIVYSFSWIYDNTRGMMRQYPFCTCNCGLGCPEETYDIMFAPELLHYFYQTYDENNPTNFLSNGTIDYFPYTDLSAIPICTTFPSMLIPSTTSTFVTGTLGGVEIYRSPYFPQYSIISAPALQWRGKNIAGYDIDYSTNSIIPFQGIQQQYEIDNDIELKDINPSELIIYNPSEATITANPITFPGLYTFKTIRGVYPTPTEVTADDISENGGPYADPRQVPVRTDLRSEDPSFPHDPSVSDNSRWASLYKLAANSKLIIEPCVKIFDAAFILNQGSNLEFENFNKFHGYSPDPLVSRIVFERNGGRLTRNYDNSMLNSTLYLQNITENSNAPNSYIVDEKIFAGENVDPNNTIGPYIASNGSDVELIAKNYIKIIPGFNAVLGSNVKMTINPNISVSPCPPPRPSNNRMAGYLENSSSQSEITVLLSPTVFAYSTNISIIDSELEFIKEVEVWDLNGKLIQKHSNLFTRSYELNLSHVNDGLYFIRVSTPNHLKVLKSIKQSK